jgi:hypothetical protein
LEFFLIQPFLGLLAESMVKFLRLQSASAIVIHVGVFIHFNVTFMWIERAEFSHQMCTNLLQQATVRSDLIDAVFSGGMAFLPDPNLS